MLKSLNKFVYIFQFICINTALCIVNQNLNQNNPANKDQTNVKPLTSSTNVHNIFNRFINRNNNGNVDTREFKKNYAQLLLENYWSGNRPNINHDSSIINQHPAKHNNLNAIANDYVDLSGSSAGSIGSANGFQFPRPYKTKQWFKQFGIKFLGAHLHGVGAFSTYNDYPPDY